MCVCVCYTLPWTYGGGICGGKMNIYILCNIQNARATGNGNCVKAHKCTLQQYYMCMGSVTKRTPTHADHGQRGAQ